MLIISDEYWRMGIFPITYILLLNYYSSSKMALARHKDLESTTIFMLTLSKKLPPKHSRGFLFNSMHLFCW